tara:strand:- start:2224 stop:2697 length:474 start_codon:yes stop_codon:yes gene_type:complete
MSTPATTDDWSTALEQRYGKRCQHSAQSWYIDKATQQKGCDDCDGDAKARPATIKVWVQQWTEREQGWGQRPDGYTLHIEREDIDRFVKAMRDREAAQGYGHHNVPKEYTSPEGEPYETEMAADDEIVVNLLTDLTEDEPKHGTWGPNGNNYPEKAA